MPDAAARLGDILSPQQDFHHWRALNSPPGTMDGPERHTLLYAGEWQNGSFDQQRMFVLDEGRVAWVYELPWAGEFGQVAVLPGGNVLFARYHGATEVDPGGQVVWNFDAPPGTEVHTCRPVGDDAVFLVINGTPARAVVLRKSDNTVLEELVLPTGGGDPHSMFRSCDYTSAGTFLLGHMDMDRAAEYAPDGEVLWKVDVPTPWGVSRLPNGNTLVSGDHSGFVREYDSAGDLVWSFDQLDADRFGVRLFSVQQSSRLANGNTLLANWCSVREDAEERRKSVQLIEASPGKQIVWMLSQWWEPNLGPASFFDVLDR